MKIALTNSPTKDYGFVALATGLRPPGETHRDIEHGHVKILKAVLHVSDT